jgi:hypothetical protein
MLEGETRLLSDMVRMTTGSGRKRGDRYAKERERKDKKKPREMFLNDSNDRYIDKHHEYS